MKRVDLIKKLEAAGCELLRNGAMTDTEIKVAGMQLLAEELGLVEAERFVAPIQREPFGYTRWQQGLLANLSLVEIDAAARAYQTQMEKEHNAEHGER